MPRVVFRVHPHKGRWIVTRGGRQPVQFVFKRRATAWAVACAKAHPLSQVVVHGRGGQIQTEWTYGDDPPQRKG